MAFSSSSVFGQFLYKPLCAGGATGYSSLTADALKVALFSNSVVPDKNAALASTAYGAGTWTTGNEVTDSTNWVAGGRALSGNAFSSIANGVEFNGSSVASGGVVTFSNAYGVLVYDSSITAPTANQGVCFNAFGGSASITNGSFSVQWNASGIFTITAS